MWFGTIGVALLMGCGSLPSRYIQESEPGVTLTALTASPETYHGKTIILGGVIVDRKQDGQRLWLHVRNRPLDKEYRPHRPTVNEGPESGYYWVMVPDTARLPPGRNRSMRTTCSPCRTASTVSEAAHTMAP